MSPKPSLIAKSNIGTQACKASCQEKMMDLSRKSCEFVNSLFIELLYPVVLVRDASNFSVKVSYSLWLSIYKAYIIIR